MTVTLTGAVGVRIRLIVRLVVRICFSGEEEGAQRCYRMVWTFFVSRMQMMKDKTIGGGLGG